MWLGYDKGCSRFTVNGNGDDATAFSLIKPLLYHPFILSNIMINIHLVIINYNTLTIVNTITNYFR